jgi:hypothetical protein
VLGGRGLIFEPHQVRGSCQEETVLVQPVLHALPLVVPAVVHLYKQLLSLDVRELKAVKGEDVVYLFS